MREPSTVFPRVRRELTLLDCAIVASAALVPVMVGIVLLVGWVRPADPDAAWRSGRSDRYVSVRHVAALKTFERAVVERSAIGLGDGARRAIGATEVLDGVAPCRAEWGADAGFASRLRRMVPGASAEPAVAERLAAQLDELDRALRELPDRPGLHAGRRVGLDASRWFDAARDALATPLDTPDAPGRTFRVRCPDLVAALAALRRDDASMLDALAWRSSESPAALATWRPDQEMQVSARAVTRRNPWSGVAGCIYLGAEGDAAAPGRRAFVAAERSLQRRLCATAALAGAGVGNPLRSALPGEPGPADPPDDPRWSVPPSLRTMLLPLETLRQPTGALYRAYTDADGDRPRNDPLGRAPDRADHRNRVVVDGAPLDVGYSVDVTIDPALQALAQKTAACYTGRHDVCAALGIQRREDAGGALGERLLEGAMVRMAAVAVIDVASGRIDALAGAMSPCARDAVEGSHRAASCDTRLPFGTRFRPDALLNPAVYHDAMPASTIKPILAATFLADASTGAQLLAAERAAMAKPGPPSRDSLRGQLMRSDSARFLDRLFCSDRGFVACRRPWAAEEQALAFGWNGGCAEGSASCGQTDLLFGRPLDAASASRSGTRAAPGSTAVAYGRLLSEPMPRKPAASMQLMTPRALDGGILSRCSAGADGRRGSDDDWEKCRGGSVIDVVAEGWGQGHARASALGVAGMVAALASAANGASAVPHPHLVDAVRGVSGADAGVRADARRWAGEPLAPLPRDAAEVIMSGLSYSHRAGTARTACEQVFDAKRCQAIDWIAGKTGTPSFPSDSLTLDAVARLCRDGSAAAPAERRAVCGSLRPYKWYVAAVRADRSGQGPWTHAIAVLTERNWVRATGRVHGAGDLGPNPSAEIAMQIAGRFTGAIAPAAP